MKLIGSYSAENFTNEDLVSLSFLCGMGPPKGALPQGALRDFLTDLRDMLIDGKTVSLYSSDRAEDFSDRVWFRAYETMRDQRDAAVQKRKTAESQRDAARVDVADMDRRYAEMRERAKTAEKRRDDWERSYDALLSTITADMDKERAHEWPKITPSGHTYVEPETYEALCHEHGNAAQAAVESWDAEECPPEPTWEMVGIARREVERLHREKVDLKKEGRKWIPAYGGDPAAHVIRESDIAAVKVTRSHRGWDTDKCAYTGDATAQEARSGAKQNIDYAIACEAIARAIEEQKAEVSRDDIEKAMKAATPGLEANADQVDAVWAFIKKKKGKES